MTLEEIIKKVSEEVGLPYDVCHKAYMAAWRFILTKAQELPINEDLTLEEFKRLRPNFNMPSLGKMHITEEEFLKKSKKLRIIKSFKEKRDAESK